MRGAKSPTDNAENADSDNALLAAIGLVFQLQRTGNCRRGIGGHVDQGKQDCAIVETLLVI